MRKPIVTGAVLALLCASCTAHSSTHTSGSPSRVSTSPATVAAGDPLDDPASAHRIVYDPGMISDPLPAPAPSVSVTAAQAIVAISRKPHFAPQPTPPRATLRIVTTGYEPHQTGPTPMWVLTWTGMHPVPSGTAAMTKEQLDAMNAEAARARCVEVEAVDARILRVFGMWQDCHL